MGSDVASDERILRPLDKISDRGMVRTSFCISLKFLETPVEFSACLLFTWGTVALITHKEKASPSN
jgi:hypothetical protein